MVQCNHHTDELVHLTIDGEELETTLEHPFYVEGEGWVNAEDLQVGDDIRSADGSTGEVEAIETEETSQEMYNLTVDKAHTFFVGDGQWLVHNSTCDIRLVDQSTDSDAFFNFVEEAHAWNQMKMERDFSRGLTTGARQSLRPHWYNAFIGTLPDEEIYAAFRGDRILGAVLIQDNATQAINSVGRPALYFRLFETIGKDADNAGRELLRHVYQLSGNKGYGGFIYGRPLAAPMKLYETFGAARVGDGFALFDPGNPAFQRMIGLR